MVAGLFLIWVIYSPEDTAWDGGINFSAMLEHVHVNSVTGTFKLQMSFTEEYPTKAPKVRFISKMFHPNGKKSTNNVMAYLFTSVC